MAGDWLSSRRSEVAADRILDAAGALFERRDVAGVGMHDIARAAGCSRATLYRYFESRDALHTAYVHREARRVYEQISRQIAELPDPAERLTVGVLTALRMVRRNPALSSWFATNPPPIGGEIAEQSEVIKAFTAAFLHSLGPDDPAVLGRRARWLVRIVTSLLVFPGRNEADERTMIEEFVVPIVAPAAAQRGN